MNGKKIIVVLVVLFSLSSGFLFANDTDNQIIGIDAGMVAGYRLSDNAIVSGQSFSLNFTVSQKVQIGFNSLSLTGGAPLTNTYAFMKLAYFLSPKLGFDVLVGTDGTNPTAGTGMFYNILEDKNAEGISTALKVRLDYLFDATAGPASGSVAMGLSVAFGL